MTQLLAIPSAVAIQNHNVLETLDKLWLYSVWKQLDKIGTAENLAYPSGNFCAPISVLGSRKREFLMIDDITQLLGSAYKHLKSKIVGVKSVAAWLWWSAILSEWQN